MRPFLNSCITAALLLSLAGCGKYYNLHSKFETGSPVIDEQILLDGTYKYYIRQLYKDTVKKHEKTQKLFSDDSKRKDLIEVEYLLISEVHKNVIYISTLPDKYQKYYSDSSRYLGEHFINIYDLKKICFGKLFKEDNVDFMYKGKPDRDVWNIFKETKDDNAYITIKTIETYVNKEFTDIIPVSHALENNISFKKADPYSIVFFKNFKGDSILTPLSDKTIHLRNWNNKYEVYFKFYKIISDNSSEIYYTDDRIPYSPYFLVDHLTLMVSGL